MEGTAQIWLNPSHVLENISRKEIIQVVDFDVFKKKCPFGESSSL